MQNANEKVTFDCTFNVPVDLLLRVEVIEPLQDLLQHGGYLRLIEWTRPQLDKHKEH